MTTLTWLLSKTQARMLSSQGGMLWLVADVKVFFYSRLVVHPKEEARVRASVEVVKVKEGKEDICICICIR